jgi:hypothetical protein
MKKSCFWSIITLTGKIHFCILSFPLPLIAYALIRRNTQLSQQQQRNLIIVIIVLNLNKAWGNRMTFHSLTAEAIWKEQIQKTKISLK